MDAVGAVGTAVAVLVPAVVVLRDIAAADRPARESTPDEPAVAGLGAPIGEPAGGETGPARAALDEAVLDEAALDEAAFAEPAPELVVAPVLGVGLVPAAAPVQVAAAVPLVERDERATAVGVAERVPGAALPEPEPVPAPEAEPQPEAEAVAAEPAHTSILAGLSSVETEEHSPLRRVAALMVLLVVTFTAAALVAAVIGRAFSMLG